MDSYLESSRKQFNYYKILAEKAVEQLTDEQLFWRPDAESNSIAIIMNHIAGNMLSRFTDFLTTDGEKPWRNRDAEFEATEQSRAAIFENWNKAWECLFNSLDTLKQEDLESIVYIRNDGHTVMEAINRQLAHYPYHVGQIVYIAKIQQGSSWQSLSIPKNSSTSYNANKFNNEKGRRHFTDDF
ncbi:DUF1572 family protein [Mucilaginibacter sp.]|uniref:DUF1572 family protein n=1 Tax=Mucilaginibacter sp. TaxID=1882438 RepID=UPI000CCA21A0|nr:DUF1572 family protein [Mucilaginibacter sp.]PLW89225.1 MAG: hypothetical protein C0154_12605 [Mucilaginibacter sp.]HEK20548.1 DUF1572 domain-containing protein [Bacteroidota bacterium]